MEAAVVSVGRQTVHTQGAGRPEYRRVLGRAGVSPRWPQPRFWSAARNRGGTARQHPRLVRVYVPAGISGRRAGVRLTIEVRPGPAPSPPTVPGRRRHTTPLVVAPTVHTEWRAGERASELPSTSMGN